MYGKQIQPSSRPTQICEHLASFGLEAINKVAAFIHTFSSHSDMPCNNSNNQCSLCAE